MEKKEEYEFLDVIFINPTIEKWLDIVIAKRPEGWRLYITAEEFKRSPTCNPVVGRGSDGLIVIFPMDRIFSLWAKAEMEKCIRFARKK